MRDFLKNIYNVNVDQILTAVMNEYTDYRHTGENKMVNRDTLLAIFSDARVSAPVVKTASLHAEGKEPNQAYLYVFRHVTKKGYYPQVILTFDLHLPYHHSSSLIFFFFWNYSSKNVKRNSVCMSLASAETNVLQLM